MTGINLIEGNLCIGGPRDGDRITVLHGVTFAAAPPPDNRPTLVADVRAPVAALLPVVYRREEITAPGGSVVVWIAEHLTTFDALVLLVRGYQGWGAGVTPPGRS